MSAASDEKPPPRLGNMETLEIEDEEARHRRLEAFMHKLSTQPKAADVDMLPTLGERKTYAMDPPSELLARVQSFLPQMEASNAMLSDADPSTLDIENISEGAEQYIEMNLGLGVFEQRKPGETTTAAADFEMGALSSSDSSDEEDDCSDTDTDESSEIITCYTPSPRLIKPLPKRRVTRPEIVVLDNQEFAAAATSPGEYSK
ncbi:hypothetical protein CYLTODRAFT_403395 [Cylindrobasidium torrendii FP15055 ss-10]|uniref:Uncharacterized protein n=1 Tax=Cylindrobasidium torrendii FP15055 ss-10 TaxID=1314674 RepID=A0A0D7AYP6_9AGAR|nr:hypothetical protein CYLTODRAFT_403395 [Cylindrobasidium torrendii FP15055 ss-10]